MTLNLQNFAPMLKTMYTKGKIQNLTFPERNMPMDVPKAESSFGYWSTQPMT